VKQDHLLVMELLLFLVIPEQVVQHWVFVFNIKRKSIDSYNFSMWVIGGTINRFLLEMSLFNKDTSLF
jgi:hypothetical protein